MFLIFLTVTELFPTLVISMNPAFILLPIALYLGGYFLDLDEVKKNSRSILVSITVGVAFKIISVGLLLQIFFPFELSWILACIIGQIDPGATLFFRTLRPKISSPKYETLSGAMSSFDDPMTAVIALVLLPIIIGIPAQLSLVNYFVNFSIVFAIVLVATKIHPKIHAALVFIFLAFGSALQTTISAGVLGLLLKPTTLFNRYDFNKLAERAVPILFFLSIFAVAISLRSIPTASHIIMGVIAGVLMHLTQIITGQLVGKFAGLKSFERGLFCIDQFNGITSCTLALFFAPLYPEIIPITLSAIVTVAILYIVLNIGYLQFSKINKKISIRS